MKIFVEIDTVIANKRSEGSNIRNPFPLLLKNLNLFGEGSSHGFLFFCCWCSRILNNLSEFLFLYFSNEKVEEKKMGKKEGRKVGRETKGRIRDWDGKRIKIIK